MAASIWGLAHPVVVRGEGPAPWQVPGAAVRFVVDLDKPESPAKVSWARFGLPDAHWTGLPVRACDSAGKEIGVQILWAAPGEPMTIAFDSSSGAKRYFLYFAAPVPAAAASVSSTTVATTTPTAASWSPEAGVLYETRAYDGRQINKLDEVQTAWEKSAIMLGRSLLPTIFEGGHRYGPQQSLLGYYKGWFDAPAAATYEFATISTDASFLLVDGKQVTSWPGRHHFWPGHQGKYHGSMDLAAGPHVLEYYNAYFYRPDGRTPVLCCIAAKAGNAGWAMLTPEANFFRPISRAHVAGYETAPEGMSPAATGNTNPAPKVGFDWNVVDQSVPAAEGLDTGLIAMRFRSYRTRQQWKCAWSFDDGASGEGDKVEHLFLRPGLRQVKLTVKDANGSEIGSVTAPVSVHPNWQQLTRRQPDYNPLELNAKHRDAVLARDPATISAQDWAAVVSMFSIFEDADALAKIAPSVAQRMKEFSDGGLGAVQKAAVFLADINGKHPAEAEKLFTALADLTSKPDASPAAKMIANQARLALAQIKLKTSAQTAEAAKLLESLNIAALSADEHRTADILRGDLALANGDLAGAKKQYQALTGEPTDSDARSSVRRTAKIDQANVFLDKKDAESAEQLIREIEWAAPIEKLAPDCALVRARIYQDSGQTQAALLWVRRVLPAITAATARSELLFRLADLSFTQGDKDGARKALQELLAGHPYSEAAAKAKAKWPGEPVQGK
ncbi:MAG: PKD domain-containing protein [Methylacidiphilales bacterium]|nr:PKD domain-containing protein [Candidatus Methylacidiphilales bacterium]